MPRKRKETDAQWLARVRAARAVVDSTLYSPDLELRAFMALFHPEYPETKVRKLLEKQL